MNKKMSLVLMAFLGSSLMVHAAQQVIQLRDVVKSVSFSGQYSIGSASYPLPEVVPAVTTAIVEQLNKQQLEFWIVSGNGWGGAGFDLMVAGQGFEQAIYHISQRVFGQQYANYSGNMKVTYVDGSTQIITMPKLSGMSVGNPVYVKVVTPVVVGNNIYMNGNPLTGFAYSNGGIGITFKDMVETLKLRGHVKIMCYLPSESMPYHYCNWISHTGSSNKGSGHIRKFPNASSFTISVNNNSTPIYAGVFGTPTTVTIYAGSPPSA